MALAQVTVWVPGQVLTAAALNSEFTNILNNPISLLSPTTGAINFNLQAHTNLLPNAISATSGSASQAIVVSGTAAVWGSPAPGPYTSMTSGQMLVGTSSGNFLLLAVGTTGQVLTVSSSNTGPAWGVVPPSGGLTSGIISTGVIFYLSTAGTLLPLAIGTSGQVLTVSTALLPSWAAAAAGAAGTVRAAVVTVTSGDLALSTAFANLSPGLTITPATTAARLQLSVTGMVNAVAISTANMFFTFTLDSSNLGGPTQGIWGAGPGVINPTTTDIARVPINGDWLTSVVSTAAHTVNVQGYSEQVAGITRTVLRTTDPPFRLSAIEIATTG